MTENKTFNGEKVEIIERDNNIICVADEYFKTTEAICEAIGLVISRSKKQISQFAIDVELFGDPVLVTDGDLYELNYDFIQFYSQTEPHLKVVWVEADNETLIIMMTTID